MNTNPTRTPGRELKARIDAEMINPEICCMKIPGNVIFGSRVKFDCDVARYMVM